MATMIDLGNLNLSSATLDLFHAYTVFSPKYMGLTVSCEFVGASELNPEYTRIGYASGWSEILESPFDN